MTNRRAIAYDVDHTLLDTSEFHRQLASIIGRHIGISPENFQSEIPLFDDDHQGYRLGDHLRRYGLELADISLNLIAKLELLPLLYPDVLKSFKQALSLPHTDIWFITKGDQPTQQFKIELILEILTRQLEQDMSRVQSVIVGRGVAKDAWLRRQLSGGLTLNGIVYVSIIYVDNDPNSFRCLIDTEGFKGLQIRRPIPGRGYRSAETDRSFIQTISSLEEALAS